jgi:hypothetical protein
MATIKASRFIVRALTWMAEVPCVARAFGAFFFDFPVGNSSRASGDFLCARVRTFDSYSRPMRLIDGRLWLVVARRRFGCRRPHASPVVLDDDDLGVNYPGQHQR